MSAMSKSIESAREEAQRSFLGKGSIIGVGIQGKKLVFLVSATSSKTEHEVMQWAKSFEVPVSFRVAKPQLA
jgi:hypothetical protein